MKFRLACLGLVCSLPLQSWAGELSLAASNSALSQLTPTQKLESTRAPLMDANQLCLMVADKLGSVGPSDCQTRQYRASNGVSVLGKPIIYKDYEPLPEREPLGRVMLLGGIHGDEYSSVSIVFKWMDKLDQYHSGLFHWRVVPLVNPDGLLRSHSQRMNDNGVDLNRNFPTPGWETLAAHYWEHKTQRNPRRYPGASALSEPESRWLAEEIASFKPDVIVSIHAPYGILDFDGPRTAPKQFGQLYLNLLGTYPGSLGNYAGVHKDIPVVTIELPYAGIMPTPNQISSIWMDLVSWLVDNTRAPAKEASPQMAATEQPEQKKVTQ